MHFDEIGLFRFPQAVSRKGSTTMVEANGVPILSYWRLGKGMVIYNGLEMDSDFYLRPEYPIFWYQMVNWITGVPDISQSNRKTGEMIHLGRRPPSRRLRQPYRQQSAPGRGGDIPLPGKGSSRKHV